MVTRHNRGTGHGHFHDHGHRHEHGAVAASLLNSDRGILCLKWSFAILSVTALIQIGVVFASGSVALLADAIHNVGDAATAIPLGIAFALARIKPSIRFTYGLGKFEDLAGIVIIAIMLCSAIYAGYESVMRFIHPSAVNNLWVVALASVIGMVGNEYVARFRIKVGKEIGSAALVADGFHARVDGMTSLAVLLGSLGVKAGFPLADPIIGMFISITIFFIVWSAGKPIVLRLLDGVEPEIVEQIRSTVARMPGVASSAEIRARWIGRRLHAEVNISVSPEITVEQGHTIAKMAKNELAHNIRHLSLVTIHIDPEGESGESCHGISGLAAARAGA